MTSTTEKETLLQLSALSERACALWSTWSPSSKYLDEFSSCWAKTGKLATELLNGKVPHGQPNAAALESRLEAFWDSGGETLPITAPNYPSQLRAIDFPPLILHAVGNVGKLSTGIGVVGTREPSESLLRQVDRICNNLAEAGMPIVTGLARGVDAKAAEATVSAGGTVIGVSPGHPRFAATQEAARAHDWAIQRGLVLSETLEQIGSQKTAYLRRNRIISGISRLVIAFGIRNEGGTFNQLQWAQDQGRPFVVVAEGASEDFRLTVPQSKYSYHYVPGDDVERRVQSLWVTPKTSSQAVLA